MPWSRSWAEFSASASRRASRPERLCACASCLLRLPEPRERPRTATAAATCAGRDRRRQDPIDGAQQCGEPQVDEIDPGDAEDKIAVGDDTFVQQIIEDIEQRRA